MNYSDLAFTPALDQAQLIRTRQISPLELVEFYLGRIDTLNPSLGSFFYVSRETAIADAQAKTEQLSNMKDTDLAQLPLLALSKGNESNPFATFFLFIRSDIEIVF